MLQPLLALACGLSTPPRLVSVKSSSSALTSSILLLSAAHIVRVGVWVGVAVGVGVAVSVSCTVGVFVGVSVGVSVGVAVRVGVSVGVFVGVSDGVSVGVLVGVAVSVGVGVGGGELVRAQVERGEPIRVSIQRPGHAVEIHERPKFGKGLLTLKQAHASAMKVYAATERGLRRDRKGR